MINQSLIVTTCPVFYGEIDQLIQLDDSHKRQRSHELRQPLPPSISYVEIAKGITTDCLEWIYIGKHLAGYYWFRKDKDFLYIESVVIQEDFQEKELLSAILFKADQKAIEWGVEASRLAVHPLNFKELMTYFKQQYCVVSGNNDFFGPALPNTFRLIMEKRLSWQIQDFSQEIKVACDDYNNLLQAATNHFGVEFDLDKRVIIFRK